jgi:hypothetical protein
LGELNSRFEILSRLTTSKPLLGSDQNTIIVEALFPFGHHPEAYPVFNDDALTELSGLLVSYHGSPIAPASSRAPSVVPDSSIVSSVAPKSGKASSIARLSVAPKSGKASSIASSRDDTQLNDQNDQNDQSAQADSNSLNNIQLRYPEWQNVLVRVRVLMRVALSCGEYGNPFILTTSGTDLKARFMANLFDQSLNELGLTRSNLTTGQ